MPFLSMCVPKSKAMDIHKKAFWETLLEEQGIDNEQVKHFQENVSCIKI